MSLAVFKHIVLLIFLHFFNFPIYFIVYVAFVLLCLPHFIVYVSFVLLCRPNFIVYVSSVVSANFCLSFLFVLVLFPV